MHGGAHYKASAAAANTAPLANLPPPATAASPPAMMRVMAWPALPRLCTALPPPTACATLPAAKPLMKLPPSARENRCFQSVASFLPPFQDLPSYEVSNLIEDG